MLRRMTLAVAKSGSRYAGKKKTAEVAAKALSSKSAISTVFRPWPTPVITAHGDYRDEAWLEEHTGGPLYEHQKSLPRLPVPTIQETLDRFLPTALPLCKDEQEKRALEAAVAAFPEQAAALQERLLARSQEFHDSSWLQKWWNQGGYLQVRDTIVINVSYFFHFADDPTVFTGEGSPNVKRAAAVLTATADHRRAVCSGQMPAESVGRGDRRKVLDSTAFKYLFHGCRVPEPEQDSYRIYDPALHHHAVVARKGHFFALDFCDPVTAEPYPVQVLEEGLQEIVERAEEMEAKNYPKLGWLTSSHRDDWAAARQELFGLSCDNMTAALELLQSGAILICLDDDEPVSRAEVANQLLTGSLKTGCNRWFDKSIQIIITDNGKAGLMGEHSMMDGMPVLSYADLMTKTTYQRCRANATKPVSDATSNVRPVFTGEMLRNMSADRLVEKAKNDFKNLVTNNSLHVQSFQGYGSDFIKKAGYSPDAYVQVAMQLATYRLFGEQVGTYEATQTRPFLHGRTETTRSVSTESAAFVQKMGLHPAMDEHHNVVRKEKLQLLQDAVNAHVKYINSAAQAKGVDRHFLGLSMLVQDGEKAPDLYSLPVFARAKRWRVSTSHLTHPNFVGWGYGQVVPDGVGLAYSIHPRHCIFNVTALRETGWTDKLSDLLEEALLEMRTLIEIDQTPPNSRL